MKTLSYSIIALLWLCSCDFVDDDYSVIPQNVKPYINEFVKQASQRGIEVSTSDLKVEFISYDDLTAGDANINTNTIRIDTTTIIWKANPESLVFHEMGHLFLLRGHDDALLFNGDYQKSIMNTYCTFYYTEKARQYYINELFNPAENPIPEKYF